MFSAQNGIYCTCRYHYLNGAFMFCYRPRSEDAWSFVNVNIVPAIGVMTFGEWK